MKQLYNLTFAVAGMVALSAGVAQAFTGGPYIIGSSYAVSTQFNTGPFPQAEPANGNQYEVWNIGAAGDGNYIIGNVNSGTGYAGDFMDTGVGYVTLGYDEWTITPDGTGYDLQDANTKNYVQAIPTTPGATIPLGPSPVSIPMAPPPSTTARQVIDSNGAVIGQYVPASAFQPESVIMTLEGDLVAVDIQPYQGWLGTNQAANPANNPLTFYWTDSASQGGPCSDLGGPVFEEAISAPYIPVTQGVPFIYPGYIFCNSADSSTTVPVYVYWLSKNTPPPQQEITYFSYETFSQTGGSSGDSASSTTTNVAVWPLKSFNLSSLGYAPPFSIR